MSSKHNITEKFLKIVLCVVLITGMMYIINMGDDQTSNLNVWTEHATQKIRPYDTPNDVKSVYIKAAKNEYEPFQIIVTADGVDLYNVDVSITDLSDGNGHTIPLDDRNLFREHYINIETPSSAQGGTGDFSDALIPFRDLYYYEKRNAAPFNVANGRNQPIWVDVYVPANTPAGLYTGTVTVTADGETPVNIPITLMVWDFEIPSTPSLKTAYGFAADNTLQGHPGSGWDIWEASEMYLKEALMHKMTLEAFPPSPWSKYDSYIGPFHDGTTLPDGQFAATTVVRVRYGNEASIIDQANHYKAKGWFAKHFVYVIDEPPESMYPTVRERCNAVHNADPELKAMVTVALHDDLKGYIDIWCPVVNVWDNHHGIDGKHYPLPPEYEIRKDMGEEVWWYASCMSHGCGYTGDMELPDYMIDRNAISTRIMLWHTWYWDISGILYWATTQYKSRDVWLTQYIAGGNGDGNLFYPGTPEKIGGTTHIPVSSIRVKMIREGMEDFEYFNLLKQLGGESYADQYVESIVRAYEPYYRAYAEPEWANAWDQNPDHLYQVREQIANKILELKGMGRGTISGTVTNISFNSIQGAIVTANGYSNTTDTIGGYTLEIPVGNYTVTASATGYYGQTQENVEVLEDQVTDVNFTLPEGTDLVGEWHFDEGSGTTATDSSEYENNGTINGATWTTGKLGSALNFDGVDDYIDCGHDASLDITDKITIMLWVKSAVAGKGGPNAGPICKAEEGIDWSWQLRYNAPIEGNYMGFQFNGDPEGSTWVSVKHDLSLGEWYHIAGTFDGTDIKCYLNGIEKDTNTISAIKGGSSTLFIGQDGWDNIFNGVIDEVKIYNRALSAEEIKADYEAGSEEKDPPASITNLQNSTDTTWINWTWANPPDEDSSHTMEYLDGAWQTNTSNSYYKCHGAYR